MLSLLTSMIHYCPTLTISFFIVISSALLARYHREVARDRQEAEEEWRRTRPWQPSRWDLEDVHPELVPAWEPLLRVPNVAGHNMMCYACDQIFSVLDREEKCAVCREFFHGKNCLWLATVEIPWKLYLKETTKVCFECKRRYSIEGPAEY